MRILRFLAIILLTFFYCLPVLAQNSESSSALKELENKAHFYKLSNGLRVILYRRGTAPVFAGSMAVRVGGSDESLGATGASHMLEHMAFKGTTTIGTKDYSKEKKLLDEQESYVVKERSGIKLSEKETKRVAEISKELKDLWILGDFNNIYDARGANGLNATTDKELTKYFVNLPRSAFEFWCWIESERILLPVMRQFYKERDVVMEERRMRFEDDPQGKLYEYLLSIAYLKHPYRNPVIGYDFDVKNLTAGMVSELHKKYYVPSNIVISLVGDIDPDQDIKTIEKYFSRIPAAPQPTRPTIVEPVQNGERRISLETKASPQIFIAYHKPNYPNADDAAIDIMAEILAGSRVSPLYRELVKVRKLAADIDHDVVPGSAYPNLLMFSASANSPHTNEEVLRVFDEVLSKFKQTGATQEQLDIAKRSVAMEYLAHLKSNLSLAQDFASSELLYNNYKASIDWYTQAMSVTLADVQRVCNTYLQQNNRTIATIDSKIKAARNRGNRKQ